MSNSKVYYSNAEKEHTVTGGTAAGLKMKNSDCLQSSITVMKCTGLWIPDNLSYRWNIAYKIFGIVTQTFLFLFIILAEIGYVYTNRDSIEHMVDAAVLLLSHLVQAVKVLTILLRQGRIKRMIEMIDNSPSFTKEDRNLQAILEQVTRITDIIGKGFVLSAGVTAVFWCIVPGLSASLTLPLKVAFPFSIDGPYESSNLLLLLRAVGHTRKLGLNLSNLKARFAAMYVYTSISVIVVAMGDAAENFFTAGFMVLAAAQTDVLCEELKAIGRLGSQDNYKNATLCVKYHQNIVSFVKEIGSIFGPPMFCQFVISSVIVCMTIYKITVSKEPIETITVVFYLICIFMEIFVYCYPGDILLNKSLLVSEAAYPNEWNGDCRTQRVLQLISLRAQRSLAIVAGDMFTVSLATAAKVVQTSYSYYALLRQQLEK